MTKIKQLIFASHNAGKIAEIKKILSAYNIELLTSDSLQIPEVEETGTTFAENSLLKSQTIAKHFGIPCLADDSGLCVDALNGAPGVFSARYAPNHDFNLGIKKLLQEMSLSSNKSRNAHFSCVVSLSFPDGKYQLFEGQINGRISDKVMSGDYGFGYDPIFIPEGYEQSFAQIGPEIKNRISHRGRAMQKFEQYLIDTQRI